MPKCVLLFFLLTTVLGGSDDNQQPLSDAAAGADQRRDGLRLTDGLAETSPAADAAAGDGAADVGRADGPAPDASLVDGHQPDQGPLVGLPYPTRTAYRIKGLQPDLWSDRNEIIGNNT